MQRLQMPRLGAELDKESYLWLSANHPNILDAIEVEIASGRTSQEIRLFVIRQTGRAEIAQRCEQAARYIVASGD